MKDAKRTMQSGTAGGPVYGLGLIGALVYYLPLAHGFWHIVLAVLKACVWPAFLVHDVLRFVTS
jgi:hypothetical protein